MGGCCAPNCVNSTNTRYRLFRFPRDPERRGKWLQMCRRDKWQPTPYSLLCEAHFEESQYELARADGWKKLKPNAVPTLFNVPNCPKPITPRRRILKRSLVEDGNVAVAIEPICVPESSASFPEPLHVIPEVSSNEGMHSETTGEPEITVRFVDESYEQDLQQAILLSKLDFEEKKKFYDKVKKDEEEKKMKKKEKKKAQPMSLEKFNSLDAEQIENIATGSSSQETEGTASGPVEPDQTFFDRIVEDTKKVLDREQRLELCKAREPLAQEAVTITHYKDLLKERDKELVTLREEMENLKEELLNSKKRYKKFCNLLASAEMCDKAKVVAEVERLHKVRDELSAEVSSLHAQLEQERSKVRQLTSELKKSQNKKRTTSETATQ